jgi:prefoldin beta subunit
MAQRIPPDLEPLLIKAQQLEAQLAQVAKQREVAEAELREIERTLSTLEKLPDDATLYKSEGYVLIKVSKEDVKKDLEERKELLEVSLNSLRKQEERIKEELTKLRQEINAKLRPGGHAGSVAG